MVRVLLFLSLAAVAPAQGVDDLEKGLAKVRKLMQRKRWANSKAALDKLLEDHANKGYARARRPEIATLMRECVFRKQVPDPDPKKLISGELLKWDPRSGKLKIRYTWDRMRDWEKKKGYSIWYFPAPFTGPHSITIKGTSYPRYSGYVIACLEPDGSNIKINLGSRREKLPSIYWITATSEKSVIGKSRSPCEDGKPYTAKFAINSGTVVGSYNGRTVIRGNKRRSLWGRLAFGYFVSEEIVVSGQAEKGWLQGKIDAARTKLRKEFDEKYDPADDLPRWLLEDNAPNLSLATPDGREWPDDLDVEAEEIANEIAEHYEEGRYTRGLAQVAKLPELSRRYMSALFLDALSRYDEALDECRRVRDADTKFVPAAVLEAQLLGALGRVEEAVAVSKELLATYPGGADEHAEIALLFMRMGRSKEADRLVKDALARDVSSEQLLESAKLLSKAVHGPSWPRPFEVKTAHYHIVTDIDKATAQEAGKILEQAYAAYIVRLERVEDLEKHRFRVFLFSGKSGYSAYCKEILGHDAAHSAGLYSLVLKQLLIWNLDRRDEMMRTVRHEGFHQYLDRIMLNPPLWFNEGLAGYFEIAEVVGGRWKFGQVHGYYARILKQKLVPLKDFLYMDGGTFMANASLHYAQAWAFIQFLRHSTRENKQLFDRFWQAFKEIPSTTKAVNHALRGRPRDPLQREFIAFVGRFR